MSYWLSNGLGFLLNHIETALDQFFVLPTDECAEYDTDALLRTDFKSRIEALARSEPHDPAERVECGGPQFSVGGVALREAGLAQIWVRLSPAPSMAAIIAATISLDGSASGGGRRENGRFEGMAEECTRRGGQASAAEGRFPPSKPVQEAPGVARRVGVSSRCPDV